MRGKRSVARAAGRSLVKSILPATASSSQRRASASTAGLEYGIGVGEAAALGAAAAAGTAGAGGELPGGGAGTTAPYTAFTIALYDAGSSLLSTITSTPSSTKRAS